MGYQSSQMDSVTSWALVPFAFMGQALSVGFFFCYGTIYTELPKTYGASETQAAWIGSSGYSFCFIAGLVTSMLCNHFGCGVVLSLGGALNGLGIVASSLVPNVQCFFITYSVIASFGASCLYFSSLLMLPLYFKKRVIIANGITSTGSSVGGMILSPLLNYIIQNYGLPRGFQFYAILLLVPLLGGFLIRRKQYTSSETLKKKNLHSCFQQNLFCNPAFIVFTVNMSIILCAYYVPFVHLNKYAEINGATSSNASILASVLLFSSLLGKMFFSACGQVCRMNRLYIFQFALLLLSVSMTLLPLAHRYTHLIAFSIVFGFGEGGFSSYIIVVTSRLVRLNQLDLAFGVMYTVTSLFSLVGPPLTGVLMESTGSYMVAFIVCGALMFIGNILCFLFPFLTPKDVIEEKSLLKIEIKNKEADTQSWEEFYDKEVLPSPAKQSGFFFKDKTLSKPYFFDSDIYGTKIFLNSDKDSVCLVSKTEHTLFDNFLKSVSAKMLGWKSKDISKAASLLSIPPYGVNYYADQLYTVQQVTCV